MYHGLHLSLMYQADLIIYFGVIQILLQPLYITETLTHIAAIYLNFEHCNYSFFVILNNAIYLKD